MEDGRQPELAAVDTIAGPCNDLAKRGSADLFDGRALALSAPALWPLLAALAAGADGDVRDRRFTAAVVAAERWISVGRPRTPYEVTITQVTFDRPYAFLAVHRPSRLVLVAGWVD